MPRPNENKPDISLERHKNIGGVNSDTMDTWAHIRYVNTFLDTLLPTKNSYRINTIIYGKMLRGIALQSNHTLDLQEITQAKLALSRILQLWGRHGNKNWTCEETAGMYLTLTFRRRQPDGQTAPVP